MSVSVCVWRRGVVVVVVVMNASLGSRSVGHARTLTHTYNLSGLPLGRDEDELKCLTEIRNFTNFILK